MRIITFSTDLYRSPNGSAFAAHVPYVLSEATFRKITRYEIDSGLSLIEDDKPYEFPQWQNSNVKSLLLFVTGRIGDALWLTALIRRIKQLHPQIAIDVVSEYPEIYRGNKDVRSVRPEPLLFSVLSDYESVFVTDDLIASRTDLGQGNCYELLFEAAHVPYDAKAAIPNLKLTFDEEQRLWNNIGERDGEGNVLQTFRHFVFGLHSSQPTRDIPHELWAALTESLLLKAKNDMSPENFETFRIYGLSTNSNYWPLQEQLQDKFYPHYKPLHGRIGVREIAILCREARIVVSADSMLVHLAASQNAPCVALMSTVPPEYRTSTYPLCVPIHKSFACDYSPCFSKDSFHAFDGVEIKVLPCYTPERKFCKCTEDITLSDVTFAMKVAIQKKLQFDKYDIKPLTL